MAFPEKIKKLTLIPLTTPSGYKALPLRLDFFPDTTPNLLPDITLYRNLSGYRILPDVPLYPVSFTEKSRIPCTDTTPNLLPDTRIYTEKSLPLRGDFFQDNNP